MKVEPEELEPQQAIAEILEYHEATKHSLESLRRRTWTLDWANMPNPYRRYEGTELLRLSRVPPPISTNALYVLLGHKGSIKLETGPEFISCLLFHSAAISAVKRIPSTGETYTLRVNPSSGNLHPTEFHFTASGLDGWPDGLFHYYVPEHAVEIRASGSVHADLVNLLDKEELFHCPILFVLTSIFWREAWKYRERAYRYCLLDLGHAWQSLALAARALGCEVVAYGQFPEAELKRFLQLSDEEPLLVVGLKGNAIPLKQNRQKVAVRWSPGVPNFLSRYEINFPLIEAAHQATSHCLPGPPRGTVERPEPCAGTIQLRAQASSNLSFGQVARKRRSAHDFEEGSRKISFEQFSSLLASAFTPFCADFEDDLENVAPARFIDLYIYVHRVEDLEPGLYRYCPDTQSLTLLRRGDQRVWAAGLSLGQDLAGNAVVAFSMVADLPRAFKYFGPRGYRYVHFEAGGIGQRFYLASEALGFNSTGIGAFFDDAVHEYLEIPPDDGQVVYHFSSGFGVHDPRLD